MDGIVTPLPETAVRPRLQPGHAWLAAALPASATRLRVRDDALAATLVDAGAELVETAPDVDVGTTPPEAWDAPCAVVALSAAQSDGGGRLVRAARRGFGAGTVRARAERTRRTLRTRYPHARVVGWDIEQRVRLAPPAGESLRLAERLPQRAFVVAFREEGPTLLDAIVAEATERTGGAFDVGSPLLRAGAIVALAPDAVLRIAVGPGRMQVQGQLDALTALRRLDLPRAVAERIPWPRASGRTGLAEWSVEERLAGRRPRGFGARLQDECLDFLVALHSAGGEDAAPTLVAHAEHVRAAVGAERTQGIVELAADAERALADVPRGFAHGDFWTGNLLVDDAGALVGAIDWDAAGDGRLPVLDLLHLFLSARREPAPEQWGPGLLRLVLPWSEGERNELVDRYCARLGLDLAPAQRHALVVAYWLEHVSHQLHYLDRDARPAWLRNNVDLVLACLRDGRPPRRPTLHRVGPADVRAEWAELARATRNVFSTPEWAETWSAHFGGRSQACLVAARDERERLVAVLPLVEARLGPLRIARLAGHGVADQLGPICAPDGRDDAAAALHEALEETGADFFLGDRFAAEERWRERLGAQAAARERSPVVDVAGRDWDAFLATRSRNLREQVRRRERKLAREHALSYRLADDAARLDADLDLLFALHRQRWSAGGGSEFARPEHERFHREWAALALERGWLRLWFLELDGVARAAWYGFRYEGIESYYQAGRDPAYDRLSVGFVLLCHSIRCAFEDGLREYRFLRGDEPYKFRFATRDEGLETIALGRTRAGRGLAAAAATTAGRDAAAPARRLLGRLL